MGDQNHGQFVGFSGPYSNAAAITPDDTAVLDHYPLALWITGAGNLKVVLRGMTTPIVLPVVATADNKPLRLYVKQVLATGTTATGIIGLW